MNEQTLFTPSAVLGLLSQIDELAGYDLELTEDGNRISLTIGDNEYVIPAIAAEVAVDEEAFDEIEAINEDGYSDSSFKDMEPVESGIIKEFAKTLMVGGLVRLAKKFL